MMDRSLLVAIAHGVATGVVLKILGLLLPSCLVSYYTDVANVLLCLYVAKFTLPLSKKKFLSERIQPENKAVLITGCDSGFGHYLAKRLDAKGFHVFASCLFPSADGASTLRSSCSKRLQILGLDVTNDDSVNEALNFVKENLGTSELWAVVNNAGVLKGLDVEYSSMDDFRQTLEVNSLGVARVTKTFLSLLRQSKGRVVTTTSIAGRVSFPHFTPYTMSKAAAVAFTECLKQEMDPWGVKVISIEPELFQTSMTNSGLLIQNFENSLKDLDEGIKADYGEKYFKGMKDMLEYNVSLSSAKIHLVVDSLESAVSLEQPDAVYKPCRGLFTKMALFFMESFPQAFTDLNSKIYMYITGFPIPKEADNTL